MLKELSLESLGFVYADTSPLRVVCCPALRDVEKNNVMMLFS